MDFSVISQITNKRSWWVDVIFYFSVSLLIATVLCWLIFVTKISMQKKEISDVEASLETVGTQAQRDQEQEVLLFQSRIADFSDLFKNHEFASEVFVFMQEQTLPNIWFSRFDMRTKEASASLTGEAENMEAFSRQVASLERNKSVLSLNSLKSSLGETARVSFNLNIALDPKILSMTELLNSMPMVNTATPSNQPVVNPPQ